MVDDEPRLAEGLKRGLEAEGFAVDVAHTGTDGLWLAREQQYAAILLDIMLPGMNGYVVCRTLRDEENWTPVLMLTAKDGEWDQVEGLDTGADDYLTKPFSPRELVARVRAVLRRTDGARAASPVLRAGALVVDRDAMRVSVGDRRVDLTATEFALLAAMAAQPGRVFTRAQLLDAIHGEAFEAYERAIDAHVKNIRRKLEPDPRAPRYLETVIGVGYRVADGERAS